ncbi:BZ3500_MvSof-1268-A1-R1_Chr1-3g02144 [Microbotryum saponariae]|uniref:BZ3500_MvSof-1268-A1-R1_Chr1-3g02144 protein n=1 Tax=Microbotryum saponariae TaxID=289078 RepID=A0A2X0KWI3_9BASI|nr:BZ3500_MvSof-1268-A1-R1_Chr1-3g02144 [Microbotryum saponariae]SCZ95502.1 BZ3501_MvSof-1269-A2-R1_Chr1-3g01747 [Microbotryum saponariae]
MQVSTHPPSNEQKHTEGQGHDDDDDQGGADVDETFDRGGTRSTCSYPETHTKSRSGRLVQVARAYTDIGLVRCIGLGTRPSFFKSNAIRSSNRGSINLGLPHNSLDLISDLGRDSSARSRRTEEVDIEETQQHVVRGQGLVVRDHVGRIGDLDVGQTACGRPLPRGFAVHGPIFGFLGLQEAFGKRLFSQEIHTQLGCAR